jgi:hypothetical protein
MGFRSDDEAIRHRVDALEGQVAEKDAEVERLKKELEAAMEAGRPPAVKVALAAPRPRRSAREEMAPDGETWTVPMAVRDPKFRVAMLGFLMFLVGIPLALQYQGEIHGWEVWIPILLTATIPVGLLLYRGGIEIDRRARKVTRWRWFLLSWSRTFTADGESIFVEGVTRGNEESVEWDRVFLGEGFLVERESPHGKALAERIAKYLDVPYGGERPPRRVRGKA